MAAPQNLSASSKSPTTVTLVWSPFPNAVGYDIERDSAVIASGVTTTSFTDLGLTTGVLYTYRVRAQYDDAAASDLFTETFLESF